MIEGAGGSKSKGLIVRDDLPESRRRPRKKQRKNESPETAKKRGMLHKDGGKAKKVPGKWAAGRSLRRAKTAPDPRGSSRQVRGGWRNRSPNRSERVVSRNDRPRGGQNDRSVGNKPDRARAGRDVRGKRHAEGRTTGAHPGSAGRTAVRAGRAFGSCPLRQPSDGAA